MVILRSKDFSDIWLQEIQSNHEEKSVRIVVSATHVGIEKSCSKLMTCVVELHAGDALYATNLMKGESPTDSRLNPDMKTFSLSGMVPYSFCKSRMILIFHLKIIIF
jgi:hypothetical protein